MNFTSSLWIAISTYSILPAPHTEWKSENMRAALFFLPVVGALLGGALLVWQWICLTFRVEAVLFATVAVVLPLLLTGGIHMDGFMDTTDALASHQSRKCKLEIMKDSHTGAFAVMWCVAYLLVSFGLYAVLYQGASLRVVGIGFVLSRTLCVLGALSLPNARSGGMLCAFTEHAKNHLAIGVMLVLSLLCAGGMILIDCWPGLCGAVAAAAALGGYRRMAKRQFGGVTGDTSGYFIQICELSVLLGVWAGGTL